GSLHPRGGKSSTRGGRYASGALPLLWNRLAAPVTEVTLRAREIICRGHLLTGRRGWDDRLFPREERPVATGGGRSRCRTPLARKRTWLAGSARVLWPEDNPRWRSRKRSTSSAGRCSARAGSKPI